MITSLTTNKPLSYILLGSGERILTPITLKQIEEKMKYDYAEINGERISTAKNVISKYGNATPIEYFEYYILPTLPWDEKNLWSAIKKSALDQKEVPSLEALIGALERKRQEEEYMESLRRKPTPEEIERRKILVAQAKSRILQWK